MILRRLLPALLLLIGLALPAQAAVTITFYSHDFGSSFPHAFILLEGTPDAGGTAVSGNFGFTAKRVTPAILMGSVEGDIESASPAYVANSQPHWKMTLSDGQYAQVLAVMDKWRSIPGKSYNLNHRNCVHFVADMARSLGLQVVEVKELMGKPRSFLDDVYQRNQALRIASADADAAAAVPILAATATASTAPGESLAPPPVAAPLAEGPVRSSAAVPSAAPREATPQGGH